MIEASFPKPASLDSVARRSGAGSVREFFEELVSSCLLIRETGGEGIFGDLLRKGCQPSSGTCINDPSQGDRESLSPINQPNSQRLSTNNEASLGENHCKSRDHMREMSSLENLAPISPLNVIKISFETSSETLLTITETDWVFGVLHDFPRGMTRLVE